MHNSRTQSIRPGKELSVFEIEHQLPKTTEQAKTKGLKAVPTLLNGSLYCLNSTWMEVIDQSHTERKDMAFRTAVCVLGLVMFLYASFLMFPAFIYAFRGLNTDGNPYPEWSNDIYGAFIGLPMCLAATLFFAWVLKKCIGLSIFYFTRLPVRLNRHTRSIYVFRNNGPKGTWTVPWDAENVHFCIHAAANRNAAEIFQSYDLRGFVLDEQGRIAQGFTIGKGFMTVQEARENWAYYLRFMDDGPRTLRLPHAYWSKHERYSLAEIFATCRNFKMGTLISHSLLGLIELPFTLIMYFPFLTISLWTCKEPIWPQEIEDACPPNAEDPFQRPLPNEPVGQAYAVARHKRDWGWISSARQYAPDKLEQWLPLYQPVEDAAQKRYPTDA
ncbi:DUF6708 domain-containing protein [Amantichitinum ursilacus]|uniref:DUF6708 domain-containing protein n=1 Tax=Amantichitinum ursilacus TaxID=857265 RepID=A0A0N0GPY1_9NEIS|nr:DUF6708 domain-containing protein [Amantichitinum ursilacus]KPC54142.1 hypothetical protein WG78_05815 [Amantichitinum ursilacus]